MKLESLMSVTLHKNNEKHCIFKMQYGDVILRIGGFHLELTMHRAYVALNWDIIYSEIANFANFKSPKAQMVVRKVSDFHKSTDIFMAQRTAKIRELLIPFVIYCKKEGVDPNENLFQEWVDNEVKDPNYKLAIQIESIYGTCLWLMHAGVHANNPKLTRASNHVFSGLFHIMGNINYSQIELYDTIVIETSQKKCPKMCQNLEKN
jgi:hypothetical protein